MGETGLVYSRSDAWKHFVDSPTHLEAVVSASLLRGGTRLRCDERLSISTPTSDTCYQIDAVAQAILACLHDRLYLTIR